MSRVSWEGGLQNNDRQAWRRRQRDRDIGEGIYRKRSGEMAEERLDNGKDGEERGKTQW